MKHVKQFDTFVNENYKPEVNEFLGFGKKKIKLDDVEPSKDAAEYSEKHPAAKKLMAALSKFNIIGEFAKKAIQAIYDFADGTPMLSKYNFDYDEKTHELTIDPNGKGLFSGHPIMG